MNPRLRLALNKAAAIAIIVIVVLAAAAVIIYQSRGGGATTTTTTIESSTTSPPAKLKGKIAVVYDIGGRGDLSFNDMAYMGASRAAKDFGLQLKEVQSNTENDYLPNLSTLAESGEYDLIIAVGFLMTEALKTVADQYPNQKFAIIDGYIPDKPNVLSILFKENEGSALVGALAAMTAAYFNYSKVGIVLGMEIPVLYKFEAGYYWGIRYGEKIFKQHTGRDVHLDVLWQYTGAFNDPAKGKQAAEAQLAAGAGVIYQVAGATGIGVFQAVEEYAKSKGKDMGPPFAIGVDSDQDWIKPGFIIASMMKRVDVGVYTAVKMVVEGKFKGGVLELGLKEDGVGISSMETLETFINVAVEAGAKLPMPKDQIIQKVRDMRSQLPDWVWQEIDALAQKIKSGEYQIPMPANKEEMQKIRQQYGVS